MFDIGKPIRCLTEIDGPSLISINRVVVDADNHHASTIFSSSSNTHRYEETESPTGIAVLEKHQIHTAINIILSDVLRVYRSFC